MFNYVIKKMVGTKNQRELRKMQPAVARINEREAWAKGLSDEQIREQVRAWQKEVADAPPKEKSAVLDRILPDSFALTRAASMRALGMRHFDVQLLGGMALHKGNIAEMKTGEGKTLVATLPCVLNALEGKGVHVVTVNDYLARRDAEWMGRLYRLMGLSVGCVVHGLSDKERQREYAAHITYGQNNEFGFDYLRDNMKFRLVDYVQRELHYAIVDEVDSILIDEARTPLIISGPSEESTDKYYLINKVTPRPRSSAASTSSKSSSSRPTRRTSARTSRTPSTRPSGRSSPRSATRSRRRTRRGSRCWSAPSPSPRARC